MISLLYILFTKIHLIILNVCILTIISHKYFKLNLKDFHAKFIFMVINLLNQED